MYFAVQQNDVSLFCVLVIIVQVVMVTCCVYCVLLVLVASVCGIASRFSFPKERAHRVLVVKKIEFKSIGAFALAFIRSICPCLCLHWQYWAVRRARVFGPVAFAFAFAFFGHVLPAGMAMNAESILSPRQRITAHLKFDKSGPLVCQRGSPSTAGYVLCCLTLGGVRIWFQAMSNDRITDKNKEDEQPTLAIDK